jgi:acyl-CoA thioester hydrolase
MAALAVLNSEFRMMNYEMSARTAAAPLASFYHSAFIIHNSAFLNFGPPAMLPDFPSIITLPVQWGEQDLFGHVNNTVYFRWIESSRIKYLEQIGLSDLMQREQIGPILAAITCNYRRQLNYPDTVEIGSKIVRLGRTSLTMANAVWSTRQQALTADSESTIVVFDYKTQKPTPIPAAIREAIEQFQGKP